MNRFLHSLTLATVLSTPYLSSEAIIGRTSEPIISETVGHLALGHADSGEATSLKFEPIQDRDNGLIFALAAGGLLLVAAIGDLVNKRLDQSGQQPDSTDSQQQNDPTTE